MPLHPAIADSGFAELGALGSCLTPGGDLPDATVVCPDLLQRFAAVSDGRRDQSRIHPVAVVLMLCAAAVVAGMRSFTAIAGWAADAPAELLAQLYGRGAQPPSKATIWRVVTGADATAVDAVIGAWLAQQSTACESDTDPSALLAIAVDGKTVRGATDTDGNQVHLLAAATHTDALVLGQVEVGAKTNGIPMFAPLLDKLADTGVDLTRTVITADALHTQRAHAHYLHHRGAGFVLTVKETNRHSSPPSTPYPGPRSPSPPATPTPATAGSPPAPSRVLPAPADLPFPHLNQVWLVERYTHDRAGTPISAVAALGVTNLPTTRADPHTSPP